MSDQEKGVNARKSTSNGDETLPDLIGRLGQDLATILDAKLNLLKIEIKEDVNAYSQYGMTHGGGGDNRHRRVCAIECGDSLFYLYAV